MSELGAADEIAKLADLKERGLLSDKEFAAQRRRVLNGADTRSKISPLSVGIAGVAAVTIVLLLLLLPGTSPSKPVNIALSSSTQETSAVNWAIHQENTTEYGGVPWDGLCLTFVQDAYRIAGGLNLESLTTGVSYNGNTDPEDLFGSGAAAGSHFAPGSYKVTTDTTSIPYGALVFFNAKPGYNPEDYSHVTIMGSSGEMISTADVVNENVVHEETFAQINAKRPYSTYVGWWLPDAPKTPVPAPAPAPPPSTTSTSTSTTNGQASPVASGSNPSPVVARAPNGSGTTSTSTSSTAANSTQASPTGTQAGSPVPLPAPAPAPAPAPTYAETSGSVVHTWTNYFNAGGSEGPSIPTNETVQIACKVTGFAVADGNTWWYRIESGPWGGNYYASADAFYNDGKTSGSLLGTPFVDPSVPNC